MRISVKVPIELTALRNKVADGARVTQAEALRIVELEAWLSREINRVADLEAEGGPEVAVG